MVKIGKLAHDIALENARCLRKSCFIPSNAPRAGRVIDDALAIVHYIEFCGFVLRPRDTHRVGIRLNVLPIVFAIIPPSRMGIDGALLTKSHQ